MDGIRIIAWVLLVASRGFVCQATEGVSAAIDYLSGIIIDIEEPNENPSIFYESFVPILLEYSLPDFSSSALELTTYRSVTGYSGLCDKSEFDDKCPPWFYMDHLLKEQFSPNLTWWLSPTAQPLPIRDDKKFCNNIKDHFSTSLTTKDEFNKYIEKLKLCSLGEMVNVTEFVGYTKKRQDYYDTMSRSTGEAYWFLPSKVDAAAALNMQMATYAIFLLDQYMESNRWKEAYKTCKSGKIPTTIVANEDLTNKLLKLESELKTTHYSLSIPIVDTNSYLNQPLTDCVFTNDSTLVLRILIPVVSFNSSYQSFELKTIPFAKVATSEVCFVAGVNGHKFLHENFNSVIQQNNCGGSTLCQVDPTERPFIDNPCISNLVSYSSTTDQFIRDHKIMCPLQCFKFMMGGIIFQRISSDTVVITSGVVSDCYLRCPGKPDLLIPTKELGALKVTIPCLCTIVFNGTEQFRSESFCQNETVIKHIVPYEWQITENEDNDVSTTPSAVLPTTTESTLESIATTTAPPTTQKYEEDVPESSHQLYADKSSSNALFSIIFLLLVVVIVALVSVGYKVYNLEKNMYTKRSVGPEDTACILNGQFYEAPPL